MRATLVAVLATLAAVPALAQEHGAERPNLLAPNTGLMFWTLIIFVILLVILSRAAFRPIIAAVEARERALEEAIEGARRDREAAAKALADQQAQIDTARAEAQRLIAEGRAVGEKVRAQMLEETRLQQQDLLERARRDIATERDRAIDQLRREAVDLAIAGASKVIERNLDDETNRALVEGFLASIATDGAKR
ncbi:MAG TPA: F0F1 ATP synthase subunit B [Gemmatimonadaceae bacterium]|nr:F0F1 ATP synthase subunit B [Gemmatimonadaceae bacterium]